MRGKISAVFLSFMLVLTASSCASGMGARFAQGIYDIASSPAQVRDNIREEIPKAEVGAIGAAGGAVKGGFYMVKQAVTGLLTALTFFNTK